MEATISITCSESTITRSASSLRPHCATLPADDSRRANVSTDIITHVEDRKGHDRRYAIAPDKIKAEVGWEPETMFAEGIKKTIAWFFENEEWMKNVTSGDYQKYYEDMYEQDDH